jgi:adenylate cyclase
VVSLLNEYFDQMVEVVFCHGGALDKFIGDALMAVWGMPVASDQDALRAVAAAQEMLSTLESFNMFRADRGEEAVRVGIGLATGSCVVGAIGARRRLDYTVIGDAVNLASRLADVAGPGQIICDAETYTRAGAPADAERLAPQQVKGKDQPVVIYRL